ncbi:MAG: WG repeat-containing protein [bacterium]
MNNLYCPQLRMSLSAIKALEDKAHNFVSHIHEATNIGELENFSAVIDDLQNQIELIKTNEAFFGLKYRLKLAEKFNYNFVGRFIDDRAKVIQGDRQFFIDKSGQKIGVDYDEVCDFHEGMARVSMYGDWTWIDENGEEIGSGYQDVSDFYEGVAHWNLGTGYNFVTKDGGSLNDECYDDVGRFSEGFCSVKQDNDCFYINSKGEKVFGEYDEAGEFHNERAFVKFGDDTILIDNTGDELYEMYGEAVSDFKDGLAVIKEKDSCYFVGLDGEKVSNKKYQFLRQFSDGIAWAVVNEEIIAIDRGENIIFKSGQNFYGNSFNVVSDFYEGLASIMINGRWGYINKSGELAIKDSFSKTNPFVGDIAFVSKGGASYYINKKGEKVFDINYE